MLRFIYGDVVVHFGKKLMENKEIDISKVSKRSVSKKTDDINQFILELKNAGADFTTTFKILADKLKISTGSAYDMTRNSPVWSHIFNADNPFTQEFLDLASEEADEVEIKDGKVISVTYKLNDDKSKG